MKTNVFCYKSTGFDTTNIPASQSVLNKFTPTEYTNVAVIQSFDVVSIKLEATWVDVADIDYVCINDTELLCKVFYFVTGITMLNERCAELSLQLDAFTTLDFTSSCKIVSGWCNRRHVSSDGLFENILPENFQPQEEMVLVKTGWLKPTGLGSGNTYITGASFNLVPDTEQNFNQGHLFSAGSNWVVTPKCPVMDVENVKANDWADIYMYVDADKFVYTYTIPQTYLFDSKSERVITSLNTARALGLDAGVTASYIVPNNYLANIKRASEDNLNRGYDMFLSMAGAHENVPTGLLFDYSHTRNAKAVALYNVFGLVSSCSGNKREFKAEEVYEPSQESFTVEMFADVSPNGKPYFKPMFYLGKRGTAFEQAISGGTWQNQPIAYDRQSGSYFTQANRLVELNQFALQERQMANDFYEQSINQALNLPMNILGGLTSLNKAVFNNKRIMNRLDTLDQSKRKAGIAFERENYQPPDITFPREPSLQNFIGNYVLAYQTHLSENDLERFDTYLSMYGYTVSEPLTMEAFTCREKYNYIEASDVTFTSPDFPMYIRMKAKQQIENGLRLWKVKPDVSLYKEVNNVVG